MTDEFDLDCATCGSRLTKREIAAKALGFAEPGTVEIAECSECGGHISQTRRYGNSERET